MSLGAAFGSSVGVAVAAALGARLPLLVLLVLGGAALGLAVALLLGRMIDGGRPDPPG